MQRDRSPASYEDPEALYERRPSAWVEPVGNWGAGRVELVQIPTPDETNDNIVAYWVPQARRCPASRSTSPTGCTGRRAGTVPAGKAWVVQTRRGRGFVKQADGDINFVVDFDGPALRGLRAPTERRAGDLGRRQRRGPRTQSLPQPGQRRLAHDRSNQAQRRRQAGRAARLSQATTDDPERDMELHPSRASRTSHDRPAAARSRRSQRSSMPAGPGPARCWRRPLRRLLGRAPGAAAPRRAIAGRCMPAPAAPARPGPARRLGRHLGDGRGAAQARPALRGDAAC